MKFEYRDINVEQEHRFLLLFKMEKIKIYCRWNDKNNYDDKTIRNIFLNKN